jgi:hypothetical protein
MAIVTYPTLLCAALFVAIAAMPSRGDATVDVAPVADARTVLLDADLDLDGRWLRIRADLAVHVDRWMPQWSAELSAPGIRAEVAHDDSGFSTAFDFGGWLSTQCAGVLKSLFRVR